MAVTPDTSPTAEAIARVFDRAAELIAERGLARGRYEADDGAICAKGALRLAILGDAWTVEFGKGYRAALYIEVRTRLVEQVGGIELWSDNSSRAQVIAGLHHAAALARESTVDVQAPAGETVGESGAHLPHADEPPALGATGPGLDPTSGEG